MLVLTIYLALALSNKNERQEFHILLILVILITTIFFCHSLIRLCMMLIHPPEDQIPAMPVMVDGYASPNLPIRVALARDEEAIGIEATKYPPPAYGLWRESVVCSSFSRTYKSTQLITSSESIQIAYIGNEMKPQDRNDKILGVEQKLVLPPQIDRHPTFQRKVSTM